jgi:hypothetical protein
MFEAQHVISAGMTSGEAGGGGRGAGWAPLPTRPVLLGVLKVAGI